MVFRAPNLPKSIDFCPLVDIANHALLVILHLRTMGLNLNILVPLNQVGKIMAIWKPVALLTVASGTCKTRFHNLSSLMKDHGIK